MKQPLLLLLSFIVFTPPSLRAQDTFSICAVDTITGQVGSAGASCIDGNSIAGGVVIISDVHPGVGVVHTQSYWLAANQNYAKTLMNAGRTPQQIIDSLVAKDAQGDPTIRQYGVVDLNGGKARVAAYTGSNCFTYKNHIKGPNYAIQGNILDGQYILDSMESRFLKAKGDLACRLMAALQGAKVVGADTRCFGSNNSSLSSFLRVACPNDVGTNYSINLIVDMGPYGFEPIDSLQKLFNNVHNCNNPLVCFTGMADHNKEDLIKVMPNPSNGSVSFKIETPGTTETTLFIYSNRGQQVIKEDMKGRSELSFEKGRLAPGVYFYRVVTGKGMLGTGKLVIL